MESKLVLVTTSLGKFIGKVVNEATGPDTHYIHLDDVVDCMYVQTPKGIETALTVLGSMSFKTDSILVCYLNNKSPYYTQYYQAVSGLVAEVVSPNFFRKQ